MPTPRIESLLSRLEKGRLKTRQTLSSLVPDQWASIIYQEPFTWQVRDLAAHFCQREENLLELAQMWLQAAKAPGGL